MEMTGFPAFDALRQGSLASTGKLAASEQHQRNRKQKGRTEHIIVFYGPLK
jgi:hypothetical protein